MTKDAQDLLGGCLIVLLFGISTCVIVYVTAHFIIKFW